MSVTEPKVTIVDDDRESRELLSLALSLEGFTVHTAANGLRLIALLKVERPDVILLDVNMSWIDGFELCRAVKLNDGVQGHPGDLHLRPHLARGSPTRARGGGGGLPHQTGGHGGAGGRDPLPPLATGGVRERPGVQTCPAPFQLEPWLTSRQARVESLLADRLTALGPEVPPRLLEAMRYSLLGGGKRLRPLLCLAFAEAVRAGAPLRSGGGGRGGGAGGHPHLLAHPRRSAGDGRRRSPSRPADQPPEVRRGDGDPRRRRAAHRGLHLARPETAAGAARRALRRARAGLGRGGDGGRTGPRHRRGSRGRRSPTCSACIA